MLTPTKTLPTNIMKLFNNMSAHKLAHAQLVKIALLRSCGKLMMKPLSTNGEEPRRVKIQVRTRVFTGFSQLRLIRKATLPGVNATMRSSRPNKNKTQMTKRPNKLRLSLNKVVLISLNNLKRNFNVPVSAKPLSSTLLLTSLKENQPLTVSTLSLMNFKVVPSQLVSLDWLLVSSSS